MPHANRALAELVAKARLIDELIMRVEGPLAVARGCRLCNFVHTRPKHRGAGRGSGMREGNRQRGVLIQHIKACHPEDYAQLKANVQAWRARRLKQQEH
jgi:hypothetical protein